MADGPKKRCFDAAFKLSVVEFAEVNTNRGAGRQFGVDEKQVRDWRKQKDELQSLPITKKRLVGGGRKAALPDIEQELAVWIASMRSHNFLVTRNHVQQKALELAQEKGLSITVQYCKCTTIQLFALQVTTLEPVKDGCRIFAGDNSSL